MRRTSKQAAIVQLLEQRISDLEFHLEQQQWARLDSLAAREFRRDVLDRIVEQSRAAYLKSPLVKRAVEVAALYVWGQDLSINAPDPDVRAVIDRFWRDIAPAGSGTDGDWQCVLTAVPRPNQRTGTSAQRSG